MEDGTRVGLAPINAFLKSPHSVIGHGDTSDMAHKISRCIEWVSSIHPIEPGDVPATSTNHRGLSAFQDGDRIELETDGLGRLRLHVRDDLKRTGRGRPGSTGRRGSSNGRRRS